MKHPITTRTNTTHLARVIQARRAYDDRKTSEAIATGSEITEPRKHRILNR